MEDQQTQADVFNLRCEMIGVSASVNVNTDEGVGTTVLRMRFSDNTVGEFEMSATNTIGLINSLLACNNESIYAAALYRWMSGHWVTSPFATSDMTVEKAFESLWNTVRGELKSAAGLPTNLTIPCSECGQPIVFADIKIPAPLRRIMNPQEMLCSDCLADLLSGAS